MPGAGVGPSALKNIKIFGWLGVVIGAINMVFGPVMIKLLVSSAEEAGGVADDDKVAVAMAIAAISGLIVLGIGAMALKNKNNPQAVKPYLIAGIVATVLTFVISIADGSTPPILFLIFGAYAGVALNSLKTGQ